MQLSSAQMSARLSGNLADFMGNGLPQLLNFGNIPNLLHLLAHFQVTVSIHSNSSSYEVSGAAKDSLTLLDPLVV